MAKTVALLESDQEHILDRTEPLWRELNGARLFFTGGTGLFGVWILGAMAYAQKKLGCSFDVKVLSREPERFLRSYPEYSDLPFLSFCQGEISTFAFPDGNFSHFLHGATTTARETFNQEPPLRKFATVADGTRRALEFADSRGIGTFLLMGSGAACGKQPTEMALMPEDYTAAPDTMDAHAALGHAKRVSEFLCAAYAEKSSLAVKVARCFTFVGPHLPMDIHYAIGNFIADGLAGRAITVKGNGLPVRSYLYLADMVIWLMTILLKGQVARIYNVGSEDGRSIAELATVVANSFTPPLVIERPSVPKVAPRTAAPDRYVPSTARARTELGLEQSISLEDAIRRTIAFYR